jgi:hypothetical protein
LAHEKSGAEAEEELVYILVNLRTAVIRRALVAWERSQETFGEKLEVLNDIDEALRNNHASRLIDKE